MRDRLILVAAAVLAFGAGLGGDFHLDDYSLLAPPSEWPWQTRPLTFLTFWINYSVGGWHALSLALHVLAALLVRSALSPAIGERAAFGAALLFAVHPIQAEAVEYVFARAIVLATVFCLLSFREWMQGRPWTATLLFGLALLAKEEVAAFPLVLLLVRRHKAVAVMLAMSLAAGLNVMRLSEPGTGAGAAAGISWWEYLAAQGAVILRNLRLLVFPWGFTLDPEITFRSAWVASGALSVGGRLSAATERG